MATKPTAKKQPFVIEPLNWVAPGTRSEDTKKNAESQQSTPAEKSQD